MGKDCIGIRRVGKREAADVVSSRGVSNVVIEAKQAVNVYRDAVHVLLVEFEGESVGEIDVLDAVIAMKPDIGSTEHKRGCRHHGRLNYIISCRRGAWPGRYWY